MYKGTRNREQLLMEMTVQEDGLDFTSLLAEALDYANYELLEMEEKIESVRKLKPECDTTDYILAAASGALCGVIDIVLVGKPHESVLGEYTDKWFEERTKDFARLCHPEGKTFDSHAAAISYLEEKFGVPYDQTGVGDTGKNIYGLDPKNHHFKSLAHNPSLVGLFFSILDQFRNRSHFITEGESISLEKAKDGWKLQGGNVPAKLFCGFVNWFGHLISDVSGSRSSVKRGTRGMGLPSPLWTWINDIIAIKSKIRIPVSEIDKAVNELAIEIFKQGFDVRFQTAQAIPVFINEMFVRFTYSVRRLFKYYTDTDKERRTFKCMWEACEPFSNPTVKRMLTVAHGSFCLLDMSEAAIRAAAGGGIFNLVEYLLRMNIAGAGRFTISIYGEIKREIAYRRINVDDDADFITKEKAIIEDYISGLQILSAEYDDEYYLSFIDDFKNSTAYTSVFEKSISLAELRDVPEDKILRSKDDIDRYFGG